MNAKATKALEDFHTITPHLTVRGVDQAITYYCGAFGASELYRNLASDGKKIIHAELMLGDYGILTDPFGHRWSIATRIEDLSPRQLQKRASEFNSLGYDNVGKKTIEVKLDNMSTIIMYNLGSISADGKVITNLGTSLDPATGKPYKLRTVTTVVDHDHFTLEWYGTEEGRKEAKVVSMSHTRKKK